MRGQAPQRKRVGPVLKASAGVQMGRGLNRPAARAAGWAWGAIAHPGVGGPLVGAGRRPARDAADHRSSRRAQRQVRRRGALVTSETRRRSVVPAGRGPSGPLCRSHDRPIQSLQRWLIPGLGCRAEAVGWPRGCAGGRAGGRGPNHRGWPGSGRETDPPGSPRSRRGGGVRLASGQGPARLPTLTWVAEAAASQAGCGPALRGVHGCGRRSSWRQGVGMGGGSCKA